MNEKLDKIGYFYLPFILLTVITINVVLITQFGSAICQSDGCKIVDDLIKFDTFYVNLLGALFAITLIALDRFKNLSNFILYAGLLFESLLIGYQVFIVHTLCYYCIGIYTLIIFTALFRRKFVILLTIIAIVVAFFNVLKFIPLDAKLNQENQVFLFGTNTCPHCKDAKAYLRANNIEYSFENIKNIENAFFIKYFGATKIPVVLDKRNNKNILIIGTRDIVEHFKPKEVQEEIKTVPSIEKNETNTTQNLIIEIIDSNNTSTKKEVLPKTNQSDFNLDSIFNPADQDEGCGISIQPKEPCEADIPKVTN